MALAPSMRSLQLLFGPDCELEVASLIKRALGRKIIVSIISGFDYVVRKQDQAKICFGSGRPRDTTSKSCMTPFMRYYTPEDFPNVGPGKYNISEAFKTVKEKPSSVSISKKGFSGLARFGAPVSYGEDYPAPGDYSISSFPAKVRTLKYPFASTAKRRTVSVNKNPGPGLYKNVDPVKRRILFEHSFGGKVKMKLGVEIKCCKRNVDVCELCGEKPIGDYWHSNNQVFFCRPCMAEERRKLSRHTRLELQAFRKLRDCSEIHMHEGTDAKIWLMHPGDIEKWTRREAYLCAYLKD